MTERNVEAAMPPATDVPTELRAPAPAPVAKASGSTPRMNASDVIRMGRIRMRPASTAASTIDRPRSRSCSANSTIRIEFLAASPISSTRPIWQKTSLASPRSHCAPRPPTTASGTPSRMMNGSTQLSYCAASTRYTRIRLSAKTKTVCEPALISSSDWPAQAKSKPGGSVSREIRSIARSASPELLPGAARAVQLRRAEQVEVADHLRRRRLVGVHHACRAAPWRRSSARA